jgi:MYXO-CTERM domain-containing protein
MKKLFLALSCSIALVGGLAAEQQELPGGPILNPEQIEALSDEMVTGSTEAVVPEPSSTFFAGLGGLALLFFVLRRRPTY